ncbi:CBS domain-containing protein [Lysobacter sp. 1R34A]|uniref:CBS domain-containing protein n=1 Tax=Lysobacter sp. 1R34A TaxID=3445786 RepID=UPI003EE9550A
MKVDAIMTPSPVKATSSTRLREVARMMLDHDVGEIPIVDENGMPVGVVTDRDIVVRLVAHGQDPTQVAAHECMTSPALTIPLDSDVKDCAELMMREQIRRVPVVDDDGRLCGMVSLADLEREQSLRSIKAEVGRRVSQPH